MTNYFVVPENKGEHWLVKNGRGTVLSSHRKQSRAIKKAKRKAGSNDAVRVMKRNGRFRSY